ncbi:hypothetical protein M2175_008930 [Bradyrhizobium elkanii]|jgi:hypothetical protein|nr:MULTISPECIES: hypothetical protein [Bradyrhizobium]MCS3933899.1 hypothetical protein [Bradyrhizobium elkanii]MCS3974456.1 hypothetical protein [Bradyrhizobium japonicum]
MASISAGLGAAIGWLEVTMYMKRMKNSLGEQQPLRLQTGSLWM